MLENYYGSGGLESDDIEKRLIAVQAALEIAKASASNAPHVSSALSDTTSWVKGLADAIQEALEVKQG
ncbi:hypothetical protein [Sodalis sp. RH22]|uniref:hypothetical protein n=1 Tax=unclassified Sodalis (in: enterobacteria) TaxID=2636512 RepID=UPI0039B3C264